MQEFLVLCGNRGSRATPRWPLFVEKQEIEENEKRDKWSHNEFYRLSRITPWLFQQ